MVRVTNSVDAFFEKERFDSIVIYGAGELGYRLGEFMNKTRYAFDCYIDKKVDLYGNYECQMHAVYCLETVYNNMRGKKVGVVISSEKYEEIIRELEMKCNIDWVCLLPVWRNGADDYFSANRLLGFFRRKALEKKGKSMPTLISNDCIAGRIYEALGIYGGDGSCFSPTINVWISYDDFLKICLKPEFYLQTEIKDAGLTSTLIDNCKPYPTGIIKDVRIQFVHTNKDMVALAKKWNQSIKRINWNNMLFIIREADTIPMSFLERIRECRFPYVVLKRTDINQMEGLLQIENENVLGDKCHLHYIPDIIDVFDRGKVLETAFDVVDWASSIF